MESLTARQQQVLGVIVRFVERRQRPPTTRELADEIGCHVKTVYQHILALERKGCITRDKGHLRVAPEFREDRGIPIVGRVAAGAPVTAIENRDGTLSIEELFGRDEVFAVRVHGDSMKDAGILDGDLVVVRPSDTVASGTIAVCYVGDDQDVTVKRLRQRADGFELVPENRAYRPIRIAKDDPHFRIAGIVVGVVRRMGPSRP